MSKETMPEYPILNYKGRTEDGKDIFIIGKARREIPRNDISYDNFKYTLYRLNRLIKYKRERIAMDDIM